MQKLLALVIFAALSGLLYADDGLLSATVGPSGIGVSEVDGPENRSFKFVDAKTHHILGDLGLDDLSNVSVYASWNKSGTRVAILVYYGTKLSELCIYEVEANQKIRQVKFDQPDPIAVYEATSKSKFRYANNTGSDSSDIGAWKNDNTVELVSGATKEIDDKDSTLTGTVSLFVAFEVHVQDAKIQVSIGKLTGPIQDNENGDKGDAFLENWEKQNGITNGAMSGN